MIDQTVRLEHLAAAADDAGGGGAHRRGARVRSHADPASELAPVIYDAVGQGAAVVVSLCGTQGDPQGRDRQAAALNEAGAAVFPSNAAAATHAPSSTGRSAA